MLGSARTYDMGQFLFRGMHILFLNRVAGGDCYCRPPAHPPLGPPIAGTIVN